MATDNTYILTLKDAGDKTFIMPAGFESNVEIHCWGAGGGGTIGASGGGGGYAKAIAQISAGNTVRLQIGQPGTNGDRQTGGLGGTHPSYTLYKGGSAGSAYDEDWDTGAGGGGGGASAVRVNGTAVCVGSGGGGAGGPGDDSGGGNPGNPGGVSSLGLTANSNGGTSNNGWSSGGGGGGGYLGGAAGTTYGDDAGNAPGGNGGQDYGNITVAGSGTSPGGLTSIYYPTTPPNIGRAGSPGYIVMIFTRAAGLQIKDADGSGDWVPVEESYVKLPEFSYTIYLTPPSSSTFTYGTNDFVIPVGVTEISVTATGGGGGGGGGGYGTGGETGGSGAGGGSGFTTTVSNIAVTTGETLSVVVGVGGAGGTTHYSRPSRGGFALRNEYYGGNGTSSRVLRSSTTLVTAAAGDGGYPGVESGQGAIPGGAGYRNGSGGTYVGGGVVPGGNGGDSFFTAGARGVASGSGTAPSGTLGSGGAGGGASDGPDTAANGGKGGDGRITINYSSPPIPLVITTGGWKTIESIYYKDSNNVWQPISQSGNITLYNYT